MKGENSAVCGPYIIIPNRTAQRTNINVVYDITIPMTTFNLLAIIKYLLISFGTWKIEFVSILENMITKEVWLNPNGAGNFYQTSASHVNRELAFQFNRF
ncbi:MAG: hypothetical protein Ta2E_00240 [Mycoplasmoidaceae bacterium]|nr:MAG: hypothetical protein Ta2E_00240 [Mycoplasmoidaceae bacterium]